MPNSIELAKIYLDNLQKIWKKDSISAIFENGALVRQFAGAEANEVKLPKIELDGLADYSKTAGYSAGASTLTFETKQLKQDRGRKFFLDVMDDFESLGVVGGNLMAEFQRTKVVPEVDAYRFAKMAQGSAVTNRAYGAIASASDAKSALATATLALDNAEVPAENRVLLCTPAFYQYLKSAFDAQRFYTSGEGNINTKIEYLDTMQIVVVPPTRFYVGITVGTNGYTNVGSAINFMIVHKDAVLPVVKHNPIRIFSPEQNQDADGWVFNFRLYHDCFVAPNKATGIYVHTATEFSAGVGVHTDTPDED